MTPDYPRRYAEYVLLERLGQGGMSEVDLARKMVDKDQTYVRFVVIKRIKADKSADSSFIRMFKDEARITSELHHENIGQVYDFGREDDDYYMALEYVPGVDVRYLINVLRERGQRVPVKVALKVIHDVLAALEYAHAKHDTFGRPMNIVHRDVNPRNVMLSIRGDVKLIDFGVAKATDRLERTRTDHVKGKFSYMAPEQISGLEIDARADLYAVGLTLHEFLAGHSPFYGLNQIQIMHRMMSGQVAEMPRVPELPDPEELRRVHDRSLARDPKQRYANAAAFRRALEEVATQVGGLPSREQMASFLASVDPELTNRIQRKMEAYAALEITRDGEITSPVDDVVASPLAPSLSHDIHGTVADADSYTGVTRTGLVVGGGVVAVSFISALVAAILVAVSLIGLWWAYLRPDPVVEVPGPQPPQMPLVEPLVPANPQPPSPQPVQPQPAEPLPQPDRQPDPVRPDPKTTPKPPPKPVPEPEPDVVPEPQPPAPVEPVPVPKEQPVPVPETPTLMGTLMVTAAEDGLMVYIDGKETGLRTPVRGLDMPVGNYRVKVEGFDEKPVRIASKQRATVIFK